MSNYEYNKIIDNSAEMTDHRKFNSPIHNPMIPTRAEYKMGHFLRYFVISEIDNRVVEIDDKQHQNVANPKKGISPHLWKAVSIDWKLKGPRFDKVKDGVIQSKGVFTVNKKRVDKLLKHNPKLSAAVNDYTLFANLELEMQENLESTPGLLVYKNDINTEYSGLYHIHPTHGPMEGPYHTDVDHARLEYKSNIDPDDILKDNVGVSESPTLSPDDSGGDRGGY
jgi:hypothetical protein